jgi:hypothetical protein
MRRVLSAGAYNFNHDRTLLWLDDSSQAVADHLQLVPLGKLNVRLSDTSTTGYLKVLEEQVMGIKFAYG